MQLTKISRSKSFEMVNGYGLKFWDKLGIEADLGENEDPKDCYKQLGQLIDETHRENNPEISFVAGNAPIPELQVGNQKLSPVESMIESINSCTEPKVLESYRLIAKSNHDLQQAYDKKLEELEK